MQTVIPNTDLLRNYNTGSERYHEYAEPSFETDDGMGVPAAMCTETYEQFCLSIEEGLKQVKEGKVRPMEEVIKSLRARIK
jgi:hypothetical protein